jgi:hypothetical protein
VVDIRAKAVHEQEGRCVNGARDAIVDVVLPSLMPPIEREVPSPHASSWLLHFR